MGGERVERARVGDFPAVKTGAFAAVVMHHHALLAVVHPEGEGRLALVDELHAEEMAAIGRPILEILRADPDIAQRLQFHRCSPARAVVYPTI